MEIEKRRMPEGLMAVLTSLGSIGNAISKKRLPKSTLQKEVMRSNATKINRPCNYCRLAGNR